MGAAEHYARLFDRHGVRVTLSRPVANGDPIETANVRARIRGFKPEEITGGIQTGARKVLLLASDIDNGVKPFDAIVTDSGRLKVLSVDDQTHRAGETLLAYELMASGR